MHLSTPANEAQSVVREKTQHITIIITIKNKYI